MGKSKLTGEGVGLEWLEWLIRGCSHGLLAFDTKSRYLVWNPAMERISGMAGEQCLGRVAIDVFPFMEETGLDQYHQQTLAGKTCVVEDHPYKIPETGKQGAMEVHYSPIRSRAGEVVGGVGVIHDVTERKARHDEAERSRRELRYMVTRLQEMVDTDRQRMARKVRDELGGKLVSLGNDLASLAEEVKGQDRLEERVKSLTATVDDALADMERITSEARSSET